MEDSILMTIAKMLLGSFDATAFSGTESEAFMTDLLVGINSCLSIMTQMGVGSEKGFVVTGPNETWSDFIGDPERFDVEMIKSYVYMKTKLMFDPPQNSFLVDSLASLCNELEFRINVAVDTKHME